MPSYKFGFDSRLVRMGLKASTRNKQAPKSVLWPKVYSHYGGLQCNDTFWFLMVFSIIAVVFLFSIIWPTNKNFTALCIERLRLQRAYMKIYQEQNKSAESYVKILRQAKNDKTKILPINVGMLNAIVKDLHTESSEISDTLATEIIKSIQTYDLIVDSIKKIKKFRCGNMQPKNLKKLALCVKNLSMKNLEFVSSELILNRDTTFNRVITKNPKLYDFFELVELKELKKGGACELDEVISEMKKILETRTDLKILKKVENSNYFEYLALRNQTSNIQKLEKLKTILKGLIGQKLIFKFRTIFGHDISHRDVAFWIKYFRFMCSDLKSNDKYEIADNLLANLLVVKMNDNLKMPAKIRLKNLKKMILLKIDFDSGLEIDIKKYSKDLDAFNLQNFYAELEKKSDIYNFSCYNKNKKLAPIKNVLRQYMAFKKIFDKKDGVLSRFVNAKTAYFKLQHNNLHTGKDKKKYLERQRKVQNQLKDVTEELKQLAGAHTRNMLNNLHRDTLRQKEAMIKRKIRQITKVINAHPDRPKYLKKPLSEDIQEITITLQKQHYEDSSGSLDI